MLGANKNVKVPEPEIPVVSELLEAEPVNLQSASARDTGLTIEEILKQVSDGAKSARENSKVTLTPKKTLEDIMKPIEEVPAAVPEVEDITIPETHEVFKEEPKFFVPFEEEKEEKLEPKVIPSMPKPVIPSDTTDYKAKYEESLSTIRKLEDENIRLINELVEAKAKIATIKDIID